MKYIQRQAQFSTGELGCMVISHHVVPVQFHQGVDPEAAPVAPHQVEVRESPVEGRFAL